MDLFYLGLTIGFFALSVWLLHGLERL